MPFPHHDRYWSDTLDFLRERVPPESTLVARHEFIEEYPGVFPYDVVLRIDFQAVRWVVLHKGCMEELPEAALLDLHGQFAPRFANAVFIVFERNGHGPSGSSGGMNRHMEPFLSRISALRTKPQAPPGSGDRTAILVTTYNRPAALSRSLPQILRFGLPVLVVDDGSADIHSALYGQLFDRHACEGLSVLKLPQNRGLPCAMNAGLAYWLADSSFQWISYLQDDVDVDPRLFATLRQIQDPIERPILTGRFDPRFKTYGTVSVAGARLPLFRSCPGVHLHAHRDYWMANLPIPTPYLGAPKPGRGGRGADEDLWLTAWGPRSVTKSGRYVVCVPNLVHHFGDDQSTWSDPAPSP